MGENPNVFSNTINYFVRSDRIFNDAYVSSPPINSVKTLSNNKIHDLKDSFIANVILFYGNIFIRRSLSVS